MIKSMAMGFGVVFLGKSVILRKHYIDGRFGRELGESVDDFGRSEFFVFRVSIGLRVHVGD